MKFLNKQREIDAGKFAIEINAWLGYKNLLGEKEIDGKTPFIALRDQFFKPEDGSINPFDRSGPRLSPQILLEEYSITKVEDLLEKTAEFFDEIIDYAVENKLLKLHREMVEYSGYCTALQNIITDEIFEQHQEAKKGGVSNEQKENAATQKPTLKAF